MPAIYSSQMACGVTHQSALSEYPTQVFCRPKIFSETRSGEEVSRRLHLDAGLRQPAENPASPSDLCRRFLRGTWASASRLDLLPPPGGSFPTLPRGTSRKRGGFLKRQSPRGFPPGGLQEASPRLSPRGRHSKLTTCWRSRTEDG